MSEIVNHDLHLFDIDVQSIDTEIRRREVEAATETVLSIGKVAMDFASVERAPRYDTESRESDVEHSFMLLLVAIELAERYFPELDSGLVAKFSGVHDFPELLSGDVPTFHVTEQMLKQKDENEAAATAELKNILPPHLYSLLIRYEAQKEPEARLVRFTDKLLPLIVDIHGPGLKVMEEDYDVRTLADYLDADQKQAQRCKTMFGEDYFTLLHDVRAALSEMFAEKFH